MIYSGNEQYAKVRKYALGVGKENNTNDYTQIDWDERRMVVKKLVEGIRTKLKSRYMVSRLLKTKRK